ncbi:TIGR03936 family radical SAM-associated protein [Aminiphilus circumscriptus]|uniref:TIGR03936 family radical SAM-associated protein n=1 Tax=Aminiphilus circumscriptus TaxID=290732 RepID=UPI0004B9535F|nr:TIGR03936 family radical SAM-associated protein [Aminiphilus circumscriptus]
MRLRFLFSKRGRAAFLPHVELPKVFARSLRRAGVLLHYTEGFSPRPKISLGPALPMGVPALAEPGEIWVERWSQETQDRWKNCLPEGVSVLAVQEVSGSALHTLCELAAYRLRLRDPERLDEAERLLQSGESGLGALKGCCRKEEALFFSVETPEKGVGNLVKALVGAEITAGWDDLFLLRLCVGRSGGDSVPSDFGEACGIPFPFPLVNVGGAP